MSDYMAQQMDSKIEGAQYTYEEMRDRIEALDASLMEALESLRSVYQYGSDTLSGRTDGRDDRTWQRQAVLEMTNRAYLAILKGQP